MWFLILAFAFLAAIGAGMALRTAETGLKAIETMKWVVGSMISTDEQQEARIAKMEKWQAEVQKQVERELNKKCEHEFSRGIENGSIKNYH